MPNRSEEWRIKNVEGWNHFALTSRFSLNTDIFPLVVATISKMAKLPKDCIPVTLEDAGVQSHQRLDSGIRRNDDRSKYRIFTN